MLTKNDLSEIRKVIREEVETESQSTKQELGAEIKLARIEIQSEIKVLSDRVKNLEIGFKKIQKDIKSIVNFFDKEYLELKKRVKEVENHINLTI